MAGRRHHRHQQRQPPRAGHRLSGPGPAGTQRDPPAPAHAPRAAFPPLHAPGLSYRPGSSRTVPPSLRDTEAKIPLQAVATGRTEPAGGTGRRRRSHGRGRSALGSPAIVPQPPAARRTALVADVEPRTVSEALILLDVAPQGLRPDARSASMLSPASWRCSGPAITTAPRNRSATAACPAMTSPMTWWP